MVGGGAQAARWVGTAGRAAVAVRVARRARTIFMMNKIQGGGVQLFDFADFDTLLEGRREAWTAAIHKGR